MCGSWCGTNSSGLQTPDQRHFLPPKDSSARRMWMSVCCNPMLVRMGAPAPTATGAMAACVSMAGVETTAVRTSMTVPLPPALRAPRALTVWPPSLACARKGRQVRPAGQTWSSQKGLGSFQHLLMSMCRNLLVKCYSGNVIASSSARKVVFLGVLALILYLHTSGFHPPPK